MSKSGSSVNGFCGQNVFTSNMPMGRPTIFASPPRERDMPVFLTKWRSFFQAKKKRKAAAKLHCLQLSIVECASPSKVCISFPRCLVRHGTDYCVKSGWDAELPQDDGGSYLYRMVSDMSRQHAGPAEKYYRCPKRFKDQLPQTAPSLPPPSSNHPLHFHQIQPIPCCRPIVTSFSFISYNSPPRTSLSCAPIFYNATTNCRSWRSTLL